MRDETAGQATRRADEEEYEGQALSVEIGRMNYPPVKRTPAAKDYPRRWEGEYHAMSGETRRVMLELQNMDNDSQEAYALWCIENGRDTLLRESLEAWETAV